MYMQYLGVVEKEKLADKEENFQVELIDLGTQEHLSGTYCISPRNIILNRGRESKLKINSYTLLQKKFIVVRRSQLRIDSNQFI